MSKLPNVGTTIFTVMSKLAAETNAINLSQGFPNFPVDPKLVKITKEVCDGNYHQYMPMGGYPPLLQAIATSIDQSYKRSLNPEKEILITAGATQAIFTTILALIDKGDEVIILDPSYDCYEPAVTLAGGVSKRIPLTHDFLPDWDRISAACNSKTKMIITNNPHNPTGRIWKEADFKALEEILESNPHTLLLSDEVYEYITFEDKHISINERPQLYDRSIIVSSFGKTFHITGWKMGYLVAPEKLMVEIKKIHQFNVFSVNSLAQAALSKYLLQVNLQELGSFYQKKRDLFRSLLSESKFELAKCEGTYFQIANYSRISELNDVDFCKELTTKYGVAAIPVSVFNADKRDNHQIRFCFAKDKDTLINAAEKLCKI